MDGGGLHGRRARPVADAPAIDASALAKAWLLTLVAEAPLQQVATVPAAELARTGPALCGGVLAALRSDVALERLVAVGEDGGAAPAAVVPRLVGARTPAAVAAGVEGLRAVAWRALRTELRDAVPELVADLGDRLAYVCARVAEAALAERPVETARRAGPLAGALAAAASRGGEDEAPSPDNGGSAAPAAGNGSAAAQQPAHAVPPPPPGTSPVAPAPAAHAAPPASAPLPPTAPSAAAASAPAEPPPLSAEVPPAASDGHAAAPANRAPEPPPVAQPHAAGPPPGVHVVELPGVPGDLDPLTSLAEELAAAPPTGVDGAPAGPSFASGPDAVTVTRVRPVDTSWDDAVQSGPPWLASIERRLERRKEDGLPFAVLVAEVDDLDRLMASQSGREVALALETAERGLTAELAPADLVVRERLGRWWLLSPDRDAGAARDLGERVAGAIGRAVLAGAPLSISIGVAVCPDDGEAVDALAGRADEGMFAARAAGVPIAD